MANLRKTKHGFTRPSIAALVFVAALLSANSAQPGPAPTVSPGPTSGAAPLAPAPPVPAPTVPAPTVSPGPTPGAAPTVLPTVSPAPSSQSSTEETSPRAWPEPGRYHPCPASVSFGNGRSVCLGLDEPRRHGYRHHYGHHYGYAGPVFESNGNAYYGFPAPSYIHTPWPIYAAPPPW
jgi:hypothetical protein